VNDKLVAAAKREHAEKEQMQALADRKKEKEELMAAKKKMMIQLERDKCERKGIAFDETKFME